MSLTAALSLLRGKVHEALENRPLAQHWYKSALAADPFCYEAYEALITNHMLTAEEVESLQLQLHSLPPGVRLQIVDRLRGARGVSSVLNRVLTTCKIT